MSIKSINSRQNQRIKAVIALKRHKGRKSQKKLLVEGFRALQTVIQSGWHLLELFSTEKMLDMALNLAPETNITTISIDIMEKLSCAQTASGLVGVFKTPKVPKTEKLSSGLVLAEVADPGNMGTLIRSTAALGFSSVVIVGGADPWSHKVIQASAGTIAQIKIFQWSWEKLLKNKQDKNLVALVPTGGITPDKITKQNSLLVVGNEAHGISKQWIKECDQKATLPMSAGVESLNAAIAGSIALYLLGNKK